MKKTLTLVLILSLVLGLFVAFPAFAAEAETVTAEWKPGQFYDSAEPVAHTKRYYTVIPCKEGDVFEFDASSGNWSGWMYPADDNGAISASVYYELKLGQKLTYTVKAEGDKMPTKLRLTVFTKDKVDITEDIWKTFDVKITKTAAVVKEPYRGAELTLDWKGGAFYHTAEPNTALATTRKYDVIPCAEGDVISVVSPSNGWKVWIYPADANGSIEGKYYGLENGGTYTVEAINGKMPTTLRITTHLQPDAVIADDAWAARDLKIFKKSFTALDLEWAGGAFYHTAEPNTGLATTRKYVVIPCTEGETIKVVSPSNGWKVWIYPADENGSIEGKYYGLENGGTYTVEAINGKMPTALRITTHLQPDAVIADDAWAARDLVILSDRIIEEEPPATSDASTVALALTAFAALAVVTGVVVLRKRTVRG